MASISAFGYLPSSPPLTGASSTNRCRTTVSAARLPDRTDDFPPLRSSAGGKCGEFERRRLLVSSVGLMIGALVCNGEIAEASQFADMPAIRGKDYGKTKMKYPDYTETPSGLQYKDLRVGTGPIPKKGEKVVVDWDGYTIGYYGRIFEARNKTKGGSFEGDEKEFFKFTLGSNEVIPAFEEAVSGMALGGIRRLVVPPELGYPENDYNKSAPRPTTFSGQRALDFVLKNQGLIDKTLLFDVELLKIVPN
ncbi:peptidyl-prolyl cis-trans isomerase FKBP19, chloroplastic-like isoform X3 [Brassica napus]|uniref:peptidyl-prolyl cis-trans isomerase FKBP19, chloroplastic isoform X3 n=1 Tax=Brassica oleracea var. oleracea TaxID=109376 RepID=UPI0006A6C83B|nr:PREDICTED: peptidyl-prolyl cis-trans isomerase FKBP19, chloroplastic isoform X3 [Brassica oleracea var. oleracea]XP_013646292.1 peptidyl-prolyl cis-trans isomerase FKBP19, chloroplastic-like isoform X3 [Brassica napus]